MWKNFVKYHGAGNDFILIDDREGSFPASDFSLIREICHRRFGVGADGLILLQLSDQADFRMRIFNSDATEASGCGNGLRCLAQFLYDLGIIRESYRIQVGLRTVSVVFSSGNPVLDMGKAETIFWDRQIPEGTIHCFDTGALHVVHLVSDVATVDLCSLGRSLRHQFNANVNFASYQGGEDVLVRTFEKGVEAETLACGTGAVAVAATLHRLYGKKNSLVLHFPGGLLRVWGKGEGLYLSGPVKRVFQGSLALRSEASLALFR